MERFLGREEVLGFHGEKGRRKKGVELGGSIWRKIPSSRYNIVLQLCLVFGLLLVCYWFGVWQRKGKRQTKVQATTKDMYVPSTTPEVVLSQGYNSQWQKCIIYLNNFTVLFGKEFV